TGAVTEDASAPNLTTSGSLTISDVDQGQSKFTPQPALAGPYGTFSLAAHGAWTYTASNSQADVQQLGQWQSITDSFTAVSSDGTASQTVTVTLDRNSFPTRRSSDLTGAVTEDASAPNLTTSGSLTISDVDQGQ